MHKSWLSKTQTMVMFKCNGIDDLMLYFCLKNLQIKWHLLFNSINFYISDNLNSIRVKNLRSFELKNEPKKLLNGFGT